MNEWGEAKAKKDVLASGAKPKPEGRVRERGRRPTRGGGGIRRPRAEAARRRVITQAADASPRHLQLRSMEAAT